MAIPLQEDEYKVSVSAKNITLLEFFQRIKRQTGLRFTYINDEIHDQQRLTKIDFKNKPLAEVLQVILTPKGFSWVILDKAVVVKKSEVIRQSLLPADDPKVIQDTTIDIMGRVISQSGEPVAAATIQVSGGIAGTASDNDGRFRLKGISPKSVITVTSVGFESEKIYVGKHTNLLITLKEAVSTLDETIVIAYGVTTRRTGIGNVSTVKSKDIEKQPVNNPLLALQGRVAGLMITQSTGLPGTGLVVRIQGQNSIRRGNDPLYIIDGIPFTPQLLPTNTRLMGASGGPSVLSDVQGTGNPLNFINPSDIESIDVLKDAEATAIYGSRAANGAILITTKKGKAGTTTVTLNVKQGIGKVASRLDVLNTQQYLAMRREAKLNDNAAVLSTDYDINGLWDTTRHTDWQKELIGNWSRYTDAQAAISGGNANTQFSVSTTYHRETSVFQNDFTDKKGALHLSLKNSSDDKRFNFQLTTNYLVDNNIVPTSDFTSMSIALAPNAPALFNADGSYNWAFNAAGVSTWGTAGNPAAQLLNTTRMKTANFLSNAVLGYTILSNLELKASIGFNDLRTKEVTLLPFGALSPDQHPNRTRMSLLNDGQIRTWIAEPQVTYRVGLGQHKIDVLGGLTFQENKSDYAAYTASGFRTDVIMEDVKSAASVIPSQSFIWTYRYNAVFGRINYSFDEKYLINLSVRRDGSSRFGAINRFNNFGSVGIGWIFSNEDWLLNIIPFVSYGKFRGSYGISGNDQLGEYQYLNLYNPPTNVGVPYQGSTGLVPASLPNPYLEWEKTKKLQLGLDLGVLKDRIVVGFTYYRNQSSNQLLPYALPLMTGYSSVFTNLPAEVRNTGFEGSFTSTNIQSKNFRWSTSLNITKQANKLVSFPEIENSSLASALQVGESISLNKVYQFAGVDAQTGTYQFVDAKGNLTNAPVFGQDQIVFVNTLPTIYGGLQNTFKYKSIELDFLFQFIKRNALNYRRGVNPGSFNRNQPVTVLSRWQKEGDETDIQRFNSNASLNTPFGRANTSNDAYADASFARLKNVQLSWTLPKAWLGRLHISSCQLYLQGQNLITITGYKGLDPESLSNNLLPPLKVYTFGLMVNL
ncbi:SusC/RagA family TonB-linked outer membrane protein [Chitinophaga sp. S165]|uniref:SusC/RagA family TonB-linked outer membrane protein n=1 Tax=Chitinophaga sp. S165 TaxID=2135462 RepID=UPI000D9E2EDC|nr:SusC/RagA family TonB-linked outer membrane protein [Chitinophaga sp. S165]PWV47101.1 TonB-linked SusC/RagA family outer membrane protein [Chitinophaga sp. S165]